MRFAALIVPQEEVVDARGHSASPRPSSFLALEGSTDWSVSLCPPRAPAAGGVTILDQEPWRYCTEIDDLEWPEVWVDGCAVPVISGTKKLLEETNS